MGSRINCFDRLPVELLLRLVSTLDCKTLSTLLTVSSRFSEMAMTAFNDKQKKMLSLFRCYQKTMTQEELKIENIDKVVFWFAFIPQHLHSENFKKLPAKLHQTELLSLSLLLCEMMLYLTEKKIIQFNSIKGYVRKLVEREFQFEDEYETVPVLGQLNAEDVKNIKNKIIQKTSDNYLTELLEHIKYMKTDCTPSRMTSRFFSLFSKNSDEQRRLWNRVDKCVGVIEGSVVDSETELSSAINKL